VIGSAPSQKLLNLDQSGQKWRVAPLSTMAPSLSLGTEESLDAISAKSDVQVKAKASGFSVLAMFANSSFLADAVPRGSSSLRRFLMWTLSSLISALSPTISLYMANLPTIITGDVTFGLRTFALA